MVRFAQIILVALAFVFAASPPDKALARYGAFVTVENGDLEGSFEKGMRVFRGVPYAAAPMGDLRWRAPRPPVSWRGTREAVNFGPACPQSPSKDIRSNQMSEDCLTLNIWSPAQSARERLPVMVWIHGGGFNTGSARMPVYDGARLAREGVVVVTLNYRLGVLGFFGHPALTEEARAEGVPTANYGLLDQMAALKWVGRNIATFGGDPGNITIVGESAGAISVLALMTAPSARGLFHKAIAQSGGGRWRAPGLTTASDGLMPAYERGLVTARELGADRDDPLRRLRTASWQELQFKLQRVSGFDSHNPYIDGELLTGQIDEVFAGGGQARVPLIVGANSYEGINLRKSFKVSPNQIFASVGPRLDSLSRLYPPQCFLNKDLLADHIWGDQVFIEPARMIARFAAKAGQPVHHYAFDFQPPLMRLFVNGTPHGFDVPYLFGNFDKIVPFPFVAFMHPDNFAASETMRVYWTNFAKTGEPNGVEVQPWPRFVKGDEQTLIFGNQGIRVERDYLKERLDAFDKPIAIADRAVRPN